MLMPLRTLSLSQTYYCLHVALRVFVFIWLVFFHIANMILSLVVMYFTPILDVATKYIKLCLKLVYKARGSIYTAL